MKTVVLDVLEVAATQPDAYVWTRHADILDVRVGPMGELYLDRAADLDAHGFSGWCYAPGVWRMWRKVVEAP